MCMWRCYLLVVGRAVRLTHRLRIRGGRRLRSCGTMISVTICIEALLGRRDSYIGSWVVGRRSVCRRLGCVTRRGGCGRGCVSRGRMVGQGGRIRSSEVLRIV